MQLSDRCAAPEVITQPVHVITGQPAGWTEAMLESEARYRESYKLRGDAAGTQADLERWWHEKTGCPALESAFTIAVPIHDEKRFLRSTLGALMLSRIPAAAEVQILLITNACSDNSAGIVRQFMNGIGAPVRTSVPGELSAIDGGLSPWSYSLRLGNIRFQHIDTSTPGKAHALTLANALAVREKHRVAICLDANNWPEPDAVAVMFAEMHRRIVREPDGTAVVSGRPLLVHSDTREFVYAQRLYPRRSFHVCGCLMGWDTAFVSTLGAFPATKSEDYALGVLARATERKVTFAECGSWGYAPGGFSGQLSALRRSMVGRMQLLHAWGNGPTARRIQDLLRGDDEEIRTANFGRGWSTRALNFVKLAATNPYRAVRKLGGFVLRHALHYWAKREFMAAPDSCTWKPVRGTK